MAIADGNTVADDAARLGMDAVGEEDVLRAICKDKWDGERFSASLFKGENTSVSRLAIIPLRDHWDMFRQFVQKPPERLLARIGEIKIEKLQQIGRTYEEQTTELTVEPDPVDWNATHAVIPQKISRGLANQIIRGLKIHLPEEAASSKET